MAASLHFGASLYVPGTHKDVRAIAAGDKLADVRNVIFCLEDAVAEHELAFAHENVAMALCAMNRRDGRQRFIRPRNPESMRKLLGLPGIEAIDGFVLPKFGICNASSFLEPLTGRTFVAMPTLETAEVFDDAAMRLLRDRLDGFKSTVIIEALRIGGNDLLGLIGMRRPRNLTIYDTPIGDIISSLVRIFKPAGYQLTAPVFEYFEDEHILAQELRRDLAHGLSGKTAIHPNQVDIIERFFKVSDEDIELARRLLSDDASGVFSMGGAMCEPATHRAWAQDTLSRARASRSQPAVEIEAS